MMSTWCSKHVEAPNKLIVKQKFCASSWLIAEINILRCAVSETSEFIISVVIVQDYGDRKVIIRSELLSEICMLVGSIVLKLSGETCSLVHFEWCFIGKKWKRFSFSFVGRTWCLWCRICVPAARVSVAGVSENPYEWGKRSWRIQPAAVFVCILAAVLLCGGGCRSAVRNGSGVSRLDLKRAENLLKKKNIFVAVNCKEPVTRWIKSVDR